VTEPVPSALEDPVRCQQLQHTIQCTGIHVAPRGQGGGRQRLVSYLVGHTQLSHHMQTS
jgi:hypothetical protein